MKNGRLLGPGTAQRTGSPCSWPSTSRRYGPLSLDTDLIASTTTSGLAGRGGGALSDRREAARRRRTARPPVVVVNGAEGEPASRKDKALLRSVPHLALDGAAAAAAALGAREVVVAVGRGGTQRAGDPRSGAERAPRPAALAAGRGPERLRLRRGDRAPDALAGRAPKPTLKPPHPFECGLGGAPTLVQNAETLAQLALVARYGSAWFRSLGTEHRAGNRARHPLGSRRPARRLRDRVRLDDRRTDCRRRWRDRAGRRVPRRRLLRGMDPESPHGIDVGDQGWVPASSSRFPTRPARSARARASPDTSRARAPANAARASMALPRSPAVSSSSPTETLGAGARLTVGQRKSQGAGHAGTRMARRGSSRARSPSSTARPTIISVTGADAETAASSPRCLSRSASTRSPATGTGSAPSSCRNGYGSTTGASRSSIRGRCPPGSKRTHAERSRSARSSRSASAKVDPAIRVIVRAWVFGYAAGPEPGRSALSR